MRHCHAMAAECGLTADERRELALICGSDIESWRTLSYEQTVELALILRGARCYIELMNRRAFRTLPQQEEPEWPYNEMVV